MGDLYNKKFKISKIDDKIKNLTTQSYIMKGAKMKFDQWAKFY